MDKMRFIDFFQSFVQGTAMEYGGFFLFLALSFVFIKILWVRIWPFLEEKHLFFTSEEKKKLARPFILAALCLLIFIGMKIFRLNGATLFPMKMVLILSGTLLAYRLIDFIFGFICRKTVLSNKAVRNILLPLGQKVTKVGIVVAGFIILGDSFGLNMKNLLAGLGIGGLAFAFAAKDTISNIFGSLMVILDRPFNVGDWIKVNGHEEGLVEEVGLRSTRVRTFYDSIISIPNGSLANVNIDNYGQRKYRRLSTQIGIQYDTPPEKIEAFCEGIRQIIVTHKWTRKDYFHVYLNELGGSSLNILLYVFWQVPSWSKELSERHRLLLDILRLGHELQVEFAFPTQTVHLFNEGHKGKEALSEDLLANSSYHKLGKDRAEKILGHPISFKNERSGMSKGRLPDDDIAL